MNLKTKRTICLMVGLMSILTIVGTISYAYFTATASMVPVEAGVSTATVSVQFDDNDSGITGELNLGESITKKFTLSNTGTVDATVRMNWLDLVNTYLQGSLTYTLSYSTEENGVYNEFLSNEEVPRTPIPISLTKVLADKITIPAGETYYYTLEITLNNLPNVDQTSDLKAKFYSNFNVEDINTPTKLRVPTSFDAPATTDEGIFEMEDDYGTSYYYRGAVTNNYVKFAGFYWRIIRVNGDGSLRIIYDGKQAYANGANSSARFIGTSKYNTNYNDNKYVGYMYGPAGTTASTSKEQAQTNTSDSTIKTYVDNWYKTNIVDKGYSNAVADILFCNDRSTPGKTATGWSSDTGLGYGTHNTAFGATARTRAYNNVESAPTFKCSQKNDAFTVSDTVKGNGALTYPVGLITADEIVAAGSGKFRTANSSYYLYRPSNWWWSLSPGNFYDSRAHVFFANASSYLSYTYVYNKDGAVAPVLNLSSEYANSLVGDGTMENPYRA